VTVAERVLIRAVPGACGDCAYWFQTRTQEIDDPADEDSGSGQVVDLSKKRRKKKVEVEIGECRLKPPVYDGTDGFCWPEMEETEWCGEFKEAVYLEFDPDAPAEEENGND
jgi:hypothetical protein